MVGLEMAGWKDGKWLGVEWGRRIEEDLDITTHHILTPLIILYQPEPTQEPSNESRSIVYRMYFIRFTSRSMAYTLR
jgi:hypothetical protein